MSESPDRRIEIPLAGGGTFVFLTGQKSLFEDITRELVKEAKRLLTLMLKHQADDYANEEWRRKWAVPPMADAEHEGQLVASLIWVIAHERERLFAELTKHVPEAGPSAGPGEEQT